MEKNQIIFGRKPVIEALRSNQSIEKVYIDRTLKGQLEMDIRHLVKLKGVPISKVPPRNLDKWTRGNHQGVVALGAIVEYLGEDKLIDAFKYKDIEQLLILDHITDVRNMGAIFRTAYFFGIKSVLLPLKGSAEINEDAMKSSAGALNYMSIYRTSNLMTTVAKLKNWGVQIVSLDSKGGMDIEETEWQVPTALIIGSEGHGVTKEMLKLSDTKILIPAQSDFDSLNVSVATGVALYEMTKKTNE